MIDISKQEYWVVRVLMHRGRKVQLDLLTPAERAEVTVRLDKGALLTLPDDSIAEPVEVFSEEPPAHVHREELRVKHPGEDFRIILNTGGVE